MSANKNGGPCGEHYEAEILARVDVPWVRGLRLLLSRGGECGVEDFLLAINSRRERSEPVLYKLVAAGVVQLTCTSAQENYRPRLVHLVRDVSQWRLPVFALPSFEQADVFPGPDSSFDLARALANGAADHRPTPQVNKSGISPDILSRSASPPPVAFDRPPVVARRVLESNPNIRIENENSFLESNTRSSSTGSAREYARPTKEIPSDWIADPYVRTKLAKCHRLSIELTSGETMLARNWNLLWRENSEEARRLLALACDPATRNPNAWLNRALITSMTAAEANDLREQPKP